MKNVRVTLTLKIFCYSEYHPWLGLTQTLAVSRNPTPTPNLPGLSAVPPCSQATSPGPAVDDATAPLAPSPTLAAHEAASRKRKRTPASAAGRAKPMIRRPNKGIPVPDRGKAGPFTKHKECSLCFEKFGTPTPVALTYMPTHLTKFHSELNGVYPPDLREHIATYRRARRLVHKRRKLLKELDQNPGTETLQAQGVCVCVCVPCSVAHLVAYL